MRVKRQHNRSLSLKRFSTDTDMWEEREDHRSSLTSVYFASAAVLEFVLCVIILWNEWKRWQQLTSSASASHWSVWWCVFKGSTRLGCFKLRVKSKHLKCACLLQVPGVIVKMIHCSHDSFIHYIFITFDIISNKTYIILSGLNYYVFLIYVYYLCYQFY